MLTIVKQLKRLKTWVFKSGYSERDVENAIAVYQQAHPAQKFDHQNYLFAPTPDLVPAIMQYALNHWLYTAVNRLTEIAATAEFMITSRPDGMDVNHEHGLAGLLGKYGQPSVDMDSFEFFERHFQNFILAGNSYWLWESLGGGVVPDTVRLLEPHLVKIRPGTDELVERYVYQASGHFIPYIPREITHFRRANPYSRYYGLSAVAVLMLLLLGDNAMLSWNNEFFDGELGIPSGIMVVPADTPDEEIERMRNEFTARHGERRRVAFVKSDAGSAVYIEAGLKHKDYDFKEGRLLSRKAVLEAVGVPVGLMAETSTEAFAIVNERRLMETVWTWMTRTTRKVNVDGLDFWPQQNRWQTQFEDIRRQAVDWRREKLRRDADDKIFTIDEVRSREYQFPPIVGVPVDGGKNGDEGSIRESDGD